MPRLPNKALIRRFAPPSPAGAEKGSDGKCVDSSNHRSSACAFVGRGSSTLGSGGERPRATRGSGRPPGRLGARQIARSVGAARLRQPSRQFRATDAAFGRRRDGSLADPYFLLHEGDAGASTVIGGREMVNFSSYDYLGLNHHPAVRAAAHEAIERYGISASASRLVAGERPVHRELEAALAAFYSQEDCLTFVSGHAANVATIGALLGPRDLIVHDALAHNSIVMGAQLSRAERRAFAHNDLAALDATLTSIRGQFDRVLIVAEGLYSMDGDLCDLPTLVELKHRHQAWLMIDDAHGLGVLGARGHGVHEHFGVDPGEVDIWMGTLSKTLAACGGYIAGPSVLIEYLKRAAGGFVYSVAMPPAIAAAALAALQILEREPGRVSRLRGNARHFTAAAREAGLDVGASVGEAIIPVMTGSSIRAVALSQRLAGVGVNVQPIIAPAIPAFPERMARLRFFLSSEHATDAIDRVIPVVARELEAVASTSLMGMMRGNAGGMSGLEIVPVADKAGIGAFIAAGRRGQSVNPRWVEPVHDEIRTLFDPKRAPYMRENAIQPFVAFRDGEPIGRIVATIERAHLAKHDDGAGFFGFIDAIDDAQVFAALFAKAEAFLRDRGMRISRGPFSLTINHESGLLVSGFDEPHVVHTNHSPPHYARHVEALGYHKAIDLVAYVVKLAGVDFPARVAKLMRSPTAPRIDVSSLSFRHWNRDFARVLELYNDAWADNSWATPISLEEARLIARLTLPVAKPRWRSASPSHNGEDIAVAVQIPDVNEALAGLHGELLPFGFAKLLWRVHVRGTRMTRVPIVGVARKWRGTKVAMLAVNVLFARAMEDAIAAGVEETEYSWMLEHNQVVINTMHRIGARLTRTFRLYEREL